MSLVFMLSIQSKILLTISSMESPNLPFSLTGHTVPLLIRIFFVLHTLTALFIANSHFWEKTLIFHFFNDFIVCTVTVRHFFNRNHKTNNDPVQYLRFFLIFYKNPPVNI